MAQWTISNLVSFLLDTQTDADSPTSERLMKMVRWMLEGMFLSGYATGDSGSATSDPPDDTTGVLTDTAAAYDVDEHNGRTLLITSGLADGMLFTIDDTTATTLVCTGDNLYDAGVRSGDTYIIFYDILVNADGHDHDGVNSKTISAIADNAVDQDAIADNAVGTGELKTATNTASGTTGTLCSFGTNSTVTHFPRTYASVGNPFTVQIASGATNTSANLQIYVTISGGGTVYGSALYHTASSPYGWLFAVRDKLTKEIKTATFAQDHPCFNEGRGAGDPDKRPHPFTPDNYDPTTEEIICIIIEPGELEQLTKDAMKKDQECVLHEILTDYDIDDTTEVPWPEDELVSVGWEHDASLPGKKIKEHFKKIKKHKDVKRYAIKKKGS